jgi:hypothetical protein
VILNKGININRLIRFRLIIRLFPHLRPGRVADSVTQSYGFRASSNQL